MKLILASKSPRRREILRELGVQFEIIPAACDESYQEGLSPDKIAQYIATQKAKEVFEKYPDCAVIGADTIVALEDKILQKPVDDGEVYSMLSMLSGKVHCVYTGYAFISKEKQVFGAECSKVYFNELSEQVKSDYVKSGLGRDKAGGYGVQDGYGLVNKVEGSYYNVVGFPKEVFEKLLKQFGF
ncbi:MAG: septum formation protein Maf [Clostridia bacterium]|nr:septum formation protein Maf [Clostridia bacterium]